MWQATLLPFSLALLFLECFWRFFCLVGFFGFFFFVTSMSEILDSFCSPDLLSDLPESRRLRAQISWCVSQS